MQDIKNKSISLKSIVVMLSVALAYRLGKIIFVLIRYESIDVLADLINKNSIIIGAVCMVVLFISALCFKFIGMGDVWVFAAIYVVKGGTLMATVLMLSLVLLGISVLMIIIYKRISLKMAVPYIPYIFICTVGVMACV